ncbi:MAG: gyrase subunit, partial [Chloroflexota bacterium]
MLPERPKLGALPAPVRAYIAALEAELDRLRPEPGAERLPAAATEAAGPAQLVTISKAGFAKRTARHLYGRQRRSGMGIFDLELRSADTPILLVLADEDQHLLLITSSG